jgi:predicted CopG family antitoxin
MATISIEREILEDLIQFKLRRTCTLIEEILERWKETASDVFIEKARKGIYEDAENDAIELRQLLLEEGKLRELLSIV